MRNKKGITLIALVITIIVLLILAGVSLSFVMGEEGILGKATKAIDKTGIAGAKEQAELLVDDYIIEFYNKRYVQGERQKDVASYVKDNLTTGKQAGEYFVKTSGAIIEVYENENREKPLVIGTIKTSGEIDWENGRQMINFTIKLDIDTYSDELGKGSFAFTAYKDETWGEWLRRMWEAGELNEINEASDYVFECMRYDEGGPEWEIKMAIQFTYASLRMNSIICKNGDKIIDSGEYVIIGQCA